MVRIPSEYQEVEYIESTGTEYIDTRFLLDSTCRVQCVGMWIRLSSTNSSYLFGTYSNGVNFGINALISGAYCVWKNSSTIINNLTIKQNILYDIDLALNSLIINGKNASYIPSEEFSNSNTSFYLFWANGTSKPKQPIRICSCKIFRNNVLAANFIPCYNKSSGEIGMYDTVSNQFYTNSGTGTFLKGNDVTYNNINLLESRRRILLNTPHIETVSDTIASFKTDVATKLKGCKIYFTPIQEGEGDPSPENVRPITGWDGVTLYFNNNRYQFLDYLYCDGSQPYIKVYENLPLGYKIKIKVKNTGGKGEQGFFGKESEGELYYVDGQNLLSWGARLKRESVTLGDIDEIVASVTSIITQYYYIGVYRLGTYRFIGNIYSVVIYDTDGNIVKNYIPATDLETGITSFYDTVNEEFILPADSNKFIPGNVSSYSGTVLTIPFPQTIYGGYVDLVKGEIVEEWTNVDMGELNGWAYNWQTWSCVPPNIATHTNVGTNANLICDIYATGKVTTASGFPGTEEGYMCVRNKYKQIGIKDSNYVSASDFKTGVSGHNLAYKLETPNIYSFTPHTLTTLRGANTIWSNSNSDVEITYWKHNDDAYQHVPSSPITSNDNFIIVTDDGYAIGEEDDFIVY